MNLIYISGSSVSLTRWLGPAAEGRGTGVTDDSVV